MSMYLLLYLAAAPMRSPSPLDVALWVGQVLLFAVFALAGGVKVFMPIARLAPRMTWVRDVPPAIVRSVGVVELAGAVGVLLPALTRVLPVLTALAALGLTLSMIVASGVLVAKKETGHIGVPLTLAVVAAFVAWGRFTQVPIEPRSAPSIASAGTGLVRMDTTNARIASERGRQPATAGTGRPLRRR